MAHVAQAITIHASVDTVWQLISDFASGPEYLPMVTHCTVQGEGIGAIRTLTYSDGSIILERLETLDEGTHCLSYILVSDTPFGSCLTVMALQALSPDRSELTWTADFHPTSLPANEALSLMEGMLAANCHSLKQLFES